MSSWNETTMGEICHGVFDGPHATPRKTTVGPVFLGISCLSNGRLDLSDTAHLSEEDFVKWTRRVTPQEGDIVFSYETRLGEAARIPEGFHGCLGRRMALARPNPEKVDSHFLLYYFISPAFQEVIRQNTVFGSTVNRIPLLEFPNFPVNLPSLAEQREIASILSALDDKIELNRRMNVTLESMARAIFKSWFVDFDPVKVNAGQIPNPGMPDSLLALFPSAFQESELGPIPKGWSLDVIGDHVELQRGKTYRSKLKGEPGPYLLGLGSIERNGGFRKDKLVTYGGESPDNLLLFPGDLYVSLKDVTQSADLLGAVARVPTSIEFGRLTQDTVKLALVNDSLSANILYRTLMTSAYRDYCHSHATGTTNLGLAREDFLSYSLLVPSNEVELMFDALVGEIERKVDTNEIEIAHLSATRDTLLPKLLSVELPIPEAVASVQEVIT